MLIQKKFKFAFLAMLFTTTSHEIHAEAFVSSVEPLPLVDKMVQVNPEH